MQTGSREPSMEDILASIKKVIAEEKELRAAAPPAWPETDARDDEEDVLELEEVLEEPAPLAPPVDLGPPLVNPLEAMIREMLRPILKQWLDDNLPEIVDEHVKREISRITGTPL